MKTCAKCKVEKDISCYSFKNKTKNLYKSWCKECSNIQEYERYQTNIVQEKSRAKIKYQNNKEYYKLMDKKWKKENYEKSKSIKLMSENKRRALKLNALVDNFSYERWLQRKEVFGNKCAYCGKEETKENKLTQDHVIPLSRGGKHMLSNVVPACKNCNSSKGTKTIKEWGEYKKLINSLKDNQNIYHQL